MKIIKHPTAIKASMYENYDLFSKDELIEFANAVIDEFVDIAETEITDLYTETRGKFTVMILSLTDFDWGIEETIEVKLPPSGNFKLLMRKVPAVAKQFEELFLADTEEY